MVDHVSSEAPNPVLVGLGWEDQALTDAECTTLGGLVPACRHPAAGSGSPISTCRRPRAAVPGRAGAICDSSPEARAATPAARPTAT